MFSNFHLNGIRSSKWLLPISYWSFEISHKMVMKIPRILYCDLCPDVFCIAYSTLTTIKVVFFVVMNEYLLITTFHDAIINSIAYCIQPSVESASFIFLAADDLLTAGINNNECWQFECVYELSVSVLLWDYDVEQLRYWTQCINKRVDFRFHRTQNCILFYLFFLMYYIERLRVKMTCATEIKHSMHCTYFLSRSKKWFLFSSRIFSNEKSGPKKCRRRNDGRIRGDVYQIGRTLVVASARKTCEINLHLMGSHKKLKWNHAAQVSAAFLESNWNKLLYLA